jgi:N-acetylneuraminate synthase
MDIVKKISDPKNPPLIVAELSGNHGGDLSKAFCLVESAIESGADAVKLQTYKPETITVESRDDRFLLNSGLWKGRYLHDLYQDAMTPWEWHEPLADRAKELGAFLFSSPFDESAVGFLESTIDPIIHKVASFELNHFPLLEKIGETKKMVFASVGVSGIDEIDRALETLKASGCPQVVLLHCVSEYPAHARDFNLASMLELKKRYGEFVGLSDHSPGHTIAVSSTALGARVIEKHFTLDRNDNSIDGAFSMLPNEFKNLVDEVKIAHLAMGDSQFYNLKKELKGANFKRSILVSSIIKKGEMLTTDNIRVARPGDGLCPSLWKHALGCRAKKDMQVGYPLSLQDFTE